VSQTVSWVKAQLADPSSLLHAIGILVIVGEVMRHWITGHAVDVGAVGAGTSLIFGGVVSDRLGPTPPIGRANVAPGTAP
jgi:hypothetical protein